MLEIIQGDSFQCTIKLTSGGVAIDPSLIDEVYITSKHALFNKTMIYDEISGSYILCLNSLETSQLGIGRCSFDITVYFKDEIVKTCVYNGVIDIKEKVNRVKGNV